MPQLRSCNIVSVDSTYHHKATHHRHLPCASRCLTNFFVTNACSWQVETQQTKLKSQTFAFGKLYTSTKTSSHAQLKLFVPWVVPTRLCSQGRCRKVMRQCFERSLLQTGQLLYCLPQLAPLETVLVGPRRRWSAAALKVQTASTKAPPPLLPKWAAETTEIQVEEASPCCPRLVQAAVEPVPTPKVAAAESRRRSRTGGHGEWRMQRCTATRRRKRWKPRCNNGTLAWLVGSDFQYVVTNGDL